MSVVVMRGLLWCLSRGPVAALATSKLRAPKRADHGIFRLLSMSFDVLGGPAQSGPLHSLTREGVEHASEDAVGGAEVVDADLATDGVGPFALGRLDAPHGAAALGCRECQVSCRTVLRARYQVDTVGAWP
jgi:hypothetical protein